MHLGERLVTLFPPVGLDEDAVGLFDVHDAGLVADGSDERDKFLTGSLETQ